MRRILFLALAIVLLAGSAQAATPYPDGNNILYAQQGGDNDKPTRTVVRVRYGLADPNSPTLTSGDVVVWDTTSADGITVSACIASNDSAIAGVLVTPLQTADATSVVQSARNWGYIAVQGYALVNASNEISAGDAIMGSDYIGKAHKMSPDILNAYPESDFGAGAAKWGILGVALTANSENTTGQISARITVE